MADTFEQLGIAPELARGAESIGWVRPGGLQRDALPIIRRGNNAVLHASAGAGATGAYALGILDRLASTEPANEADAAVDVGVDVAVGAAPRALVITPDTHVASGVATCMARLAAATDLQVRALAPGWVGREAHLLVASAEVAVAAVRDSTLKVDGLEALVVHAADQLAATDQWDTLEVLLEASPSGAQRVLLTARLDAATESFIERHVRKAMNIPSRPVEVQEDQPEPFVTVEYVLAPEGDKVAASAELIAATEAAEVAVICRTAARAQRVASELGARGMIVAGGDDDSGDDSGDGGGDGDSGDDGRGGPRILVLPWLEADRRSTRADVVSFDVPLDADILGELHSRGGTILVTPTELPHLHQIGARAGIALKPVRSRARPVLGPTERVRRQLRETVQRGDLAADLALIEPLLEEFPATELAAAALQLARAAGAARAAATEGEAQPGRVSEPARSTAAPSAPPPVSTWVRLFISAGTRDGLGPGDLVGAITGEAGLQGAQVGKIEMRDTHSTVEVPTESASAVIQALNGRSLKGRSLRVDYDRRERTPRRPPPRGGPRGSGGPGKRPRPGGASGRT